MHRQTIELVRRAEQCGVSWITVHGRTPKQRAEPASMEAIKLVSLLSRNSRLICGIFCLDRVIQKFVFR